MAVDLTSIFRKINQRKATGGYVPQGFAEDVMKANLGAEIARNQTEQQIAEQKRQFEISKAEQTRQFDVNKAFQEDQAAKAAAARASEFATTTQLTNEQRDASKTQGLTSSIVQLPMAAASAKYLWNSGDKALPPGEKPPLGTAGNPTETQTLTPGGDPNLRPTNPIYESKPTTQYDPNLNVTDTVPDKNPLVSDAYNPNKGNMQFNADTGEYDVVPAEAGGVTAAENVPATLNTTGTQSLEGMNAPATSTGATATGETGGATLGGAANVLGYIKLADMIRQDQGQLDRPYGERGASAKGTSAPVMGGPAAVGEALGVGSDSNYIGNILNTGPKMEEKIVGEPLDEAFKGNIWGSAKTATEGIAAAPGDTWQSVKKVAGKVICTELHRQGLLSNFLFENESPYRGMVADGVYAGYRMLADPIVPLMARYKLFARFMALFAVPAAQEMAHRVNNDIEGSSFGRLILGVFLPICYQLGIRRGNLVDPIIP